MRSRRESGLRGTWGDAAPAASGTRSSPTVHSRRLHRNPVAPDPSLGLGTRHTGFHLPAFAPLRFSAWKGVAILPAPSACPSCSLMESQGIARCRSCSAHSVHVCSLGSTSMLPSLQRLVEWHVPGGFPSTQRSPSGTSAVVFLNQNCQVLGRDAPGVPISGGRRALVSAGHSGNDMKCLSWQWAVSATDIKMLETQASPANKQSHTPSLPISQGAKTDKDSPCLYIPRSGGQALKCQTALAF